MESSKCIRACANLAQINTCKEKLQVHASLFSQLSNVLELAGNEVRLKILYLLQEEHELCPCDISDILTMTIPAVSQHLRKLKEGNLIKSRRHGQTIYYSLRAEHKSVLIPFFMYINQQELQTL